MSSLHTFQSFAHELILLIVEVPEGFLEAEVNGKVDREKDGGMERGESNKQVER